MRLILDTESTGLWKDGLDTLDPSQPHLCQLGARLYATDWKLVGRITLLIRPDGWEIEAGAEAVHGISTLRCSRYGVPLLAALVPFASMAETASVLVAHNMLFDSRIIQASLHRVGADAQWLRRAKKLCTMEAATPVLKLPGQYGDKFPSLEEAVHAARPGFDFHTKHDADEDIEATAVVYRWLLDGGHIKEPEREFAI